MTSMLDHKELVKPTAFKKEIDRHEKKTIDTYASISTSNTSETILELLNKADSRERASQLLEKLEQERHAWEGEEFAASHKRLYAILTQCYCSFSIGHFIHCNLLLLWCNWINFKHSGFNFK